MAKPLSAKSSEKKEVDEDDAFLGTPKVKRLFESMHLIVSRFGFKDEAEIAEKDKALGIVKTLKADAKIIEAA